MFEGSTTLIIPSTQTPSKFDHAGALLEYAWVIIFLRVVRVAVLGLSLVVLV
jgi:hypothetical protein